MSRFVFCLWVASTMLLAACDPRAPKHATSEKTETKAAEVKTPEGLQVCEERLVARLKNPKSYDRLDFAIMPAELRPVQDVRAEIDRVLSNEYLISTGRFPDETSIQEQVDRFYTKDDARSVLTAHVAIEYLAENSLGGHERAQVYCLFANDEPTDSANASWTPTSPSQFRHIWFKQN